MSGDSSLILIQSDKRTDDDDRIKNVLYKFGDITESGTYYVRYTMPCA